MGGSTLGLFMVGCHCGVSLWGVESFSNQSEHFDFFKFIFDDDVIMAAILNFE